MNSIARGVQSVREQIRKAALACGRDPQSVTLMAVSKRQDIASIQQAYAAGCRDFGESYVQEAVAKIERLAAQDMVWHFIGPIQSNKTQTIAAHFQWVHSVERDKIAQRLNDQRPEGLPPLNVCIQVNVSGEESKSGVRVEQVPQLAEQISGCDRLRLRGLMTIARQTRDPSELHRTFAGLRTALQELNSLGMSLDTLSMGMSGDLHAAIAEGATIVRVGTGIFGAREY